MILLDGAYFDVTVTDYAGNSTSSNSWDQGKLRVIRDCTGPQLTISANPTKSNKVDFLIQREDPKITVKGKEFNGSGVALKMINEEKIMLQNGELLGSPSYGYSYDGNGNPYNIRDYVSILAGVDGYVTLYIKSNAVLDNVANGNSATDYRVLVDRTAPVINDVTGVPTDWVKETTLSVIASDAGVGGIQYSFDNGATYSSTNQHRVTSNGTINIKVKDSLGNESETKVVRIDKIDNIVPTISTVDQKRVSKYVTEVTVNATDSESGVAEYSFDNGANWQTSSTKSFTETTVAEIKVKDRVGNISNVKTETITVNGNLPIVKIENNGGDYVIPTGETVATVHPVVEVEADSNCTIYYAVSNSSNQEPTNYNEVSNTNKVTLNLQIGEGNNYLWVYARDEYGVESGKYKSNVFNVKQSNITLTPNTTDWTNQDVTVNIAYGEGLTENQKAGVGNNKAPNATQVTLSENGTVYAEATDKAGNKVHNSLVINNIDKTAPVVEIANKKKDYILGSVEETIHMDNHISITEENLKEVDYTWVRENKVPTNWENHFTAEELSAKNANVFKNATKNDVGVWYLYVKAIDQAGNVTIVNTEELVVKPAINLEGIDQIGKLKVVDGIAYAILSEGTKANDLLKYIDSLCEVSIKTADGKEVSGNTSLATNQVITVDGISAQCIIVIKGDVTGDGIVTMSDILKLNQYRLNKLQLKTAEILAGNVIDSDNTIDMRDILKINQYRLKKISQL